MKKHLIYLIGALLIVSCNKAPSIEPEPLIYTGHVNQMIYFKGDSIKVYRDVKIKFRDSKYDFCTIEISPIKE